MAQTNDNAAGPGHEYADNAPTPADLKALHETRSEHAPANYRARQPQALKSEVDRSPYHPSPLLNPLQLAGPLRDHAYIDNATGQLAWKEDDVGSYLNPVKDLLTTTHSSLEALGTYKAAAHANGEWSEGQAVLKIAENAERVQLFLCKKWDAVTATLDKQISSMEKDLQAPVRAAADRPAIASELRAHFKAMSPDKRMSELQGAITRGDFDVAASVLGAPPMLSGLTPEMHGILTRMLNEKQSPQLSKRLAAVKAAHNYLTSHARVIDETNRAVGVSSSKLSKLRAGKTESERARALVDSRIGISGI